MINEKPEQKELQIKTLHESVWWEVDDPRWNLGKNNKRTKDYQFYQAVNLATDSYIIIFTGWRGGGKTTTMTAKALQAQYMFNMRLISNYPIEYMLNRRDGTSQLIKAEPLDLYKLLCFDADYTNCLIIIDEAPDIISHMAATTWKNRLLNVFVRQLRKNHNSLFIGAQQFELLDKSFRWQTDIIVHCEDASRKYGDMSLARGEVVELEVLDNSGMWTGHTWEEEQAFNRAHGNYKKGEYDVVYPRILWGDDEHKPVFDTYFQQDIWESLKKVDMNIEKYSVGDPKKEDAAEQRKEAAMVKIQNTLTSKATRIMCTDLYEGMAQNEKADIGRLLLKCGAKKRHSRNGDYYELTELDINKADS